MKAFLTAAALAVLPLAASAATVTVTGPGAYTATDSILPGGAAYLNVIVDEPVTVSFAFAGTGKAEDVSDITWKINGVGPSYTWVEVKDFGFIAAGLGTAPSFTATDDFFVQFYDGVSQLVGLSFTVYAEEATPVPVPAAGLLAGAGVIALGALKARRKA